MADKVCPVCGVSMAKRNPKAHALTHYPEFLNPQNSSPEARANQKAILSGGVAKPSALTTAKAEG